MEERWLEDEIAMNRERMRTKWISDSVYRAITPALRQDLLQVLKREEIVYCYAGNVENSLRGRGEHELAWQLLEDLVLLPYPLRERSK